MKPINYMELLGDLPEDLIDCAFLTADSAEQQTQTGQAIRETKGEDTMKEHGAERTKPASFRIGRAGIAAAVALCIGLNAALIYGISKMKTPDTSTPGTSVSGESEPALQDPAKPHMELAADITDPMPTCIMIRVVYPTQDYSRYNPVFIVTQNGEKVADCEEESHISQGEVMHLLRYEQLPSGRYTLVNLADDGKSEGILGHLDFEIPKEFDDMIWIPSVYGMQYEEAEELLTEKGVNVVRKPAVYDSDEPFGTVISQNVPPYKTIHEGGLWQDFLYDDGKGFWVKPGDEIKLGVKTDAAGDLTTVPEITNMSWIAAQAALQDHGLFPVKRGVHSDKVPFNQTISIDPEPGTTMTVGSKVSVTVSLGPELSEETPNLSGMDWEKAKQTAKEAGIQPIKYLAASSDEYPPGTVVGQGDLFGNTTNQELYIELYVAKKEDEHDIEMRFSFSEYEPNRNYYFYVQNEAGEILGATLPFRVGSKGGFTTDYLYPDCTEENTKVTAVLADWNTGEGEIAGSYILHPENGYYDILFENIGAACRALNE